ncbi:MAG: RNA methyltransferase [Deltaproteobacteria bacterium]|nr:MAG: RNA methyltransferase [Deltaproteobacteria bacterium]
MYAFIFGIRTIQSIIDYQPQRIVRLIFSEYPKFLNRKQLHIPYEIWEKNTFKQVFGKATSNQGLCLISKQFPYQKLKSIDLNKIYLCIIINEIENPGNLGRAFRSSFLLNANLIMITKNKTTPISPMAEKVATGYASRIPVVQISNIYKTITQLKKNGFWIIGSCTNRNSYSINNFQFPNKIALIIGNEVSGIPNKIKNKCDFIVSIPTLNKESLNASDALLIFLFEISKKNEIPLC